MHKSKAAAHSIKKQFQRIGADVRIAEVAIQERSAILDVRRGDRGREVFVIEHGPDAELRVLDVDPECRHLLFLVKGRNDKARFLCGHDERHWFVAAIPEREPVKTIAEAFEALKPDEVRLAERNLRSDAKVRRRNQKRLRQGEWFFIPAPNFTPPKSVPIFEGRAVGPHFQRPMVRPPTPDGGSRALRGRAGLGAYARCF